MRTRIKGANDVTTLNSTGHRIRQMRMERGWTQEQLAERLSDPEGRPTTKATVSKIERSTMRLSEAWLERFAAAFETTVAGLRGEQPEQNVVRRVPVVGRIAAGNYAEAIADPQGYVQAVNASEHAFALEPQGDSMDRAIPAGEKVIIEPRDTDLRDGKIYAVMNGDGETTLKFFRADPARLEPSSTNPVHQPIKLGAAPFTVIGRATQIIMPL